MDYRPPWQKIARTPMVKENRTRPEDATKALQKLTITGQGTH